MLPRVAEQFLPRPSHSDNSELALDGFCFADTLLYFAWRFISSISSTQLACSQKTRFLLGVLGGRVQGAEIINQGQI